MKICALLFVLLFTHAAMAELEKTTVEPADMKILKRSLRQIHLQLSKKERVVFAQTEPVRAKNSGGYEYWPSIFVSEGKKVFQAQLKQFKGYTWKYGSAIAEKGLLWGVLDSSVEGPANELPIALSTDRGKSWEFAVLKKPVYLAQFMNFSMAENGVGSILLKVGEEALPEFQGLHTYRTKDGGRTWEAQEIVRDRTQSGYVEACAFSMHPTKKIKERCRLPAEILQAAGK